ncbi:MAG: hypothetical protein NW226_01600 [Microscillaceae bacterium]|nr:hypothetical protein [Microscillaceae bacterium]
MYTKFITLFLDDLEDEEKGFLNAARYLNEQGILEENQKTKLEQNLSWIEVHLKRRPEFEALDENDILNLPMSWLKESASEHIHKMDEIREILEENDILVEVLQVETPGKILYEDEHQVVAIPFNVEQESMHL